MRLICPYRRLFYLCDFISYRFERVRHVTAQEAQSCPNNLSVHAQRSFYALDAETRKGDTPVWYGESPYEIEQRLGLKEGA